MPQMGDRATKTYVDDAIDTDIATHAAIATAHQNAPALIAAHTGNDDAHHTKYTDAEAQAIADAQIATHTTDLSAHHKSLFELYKIGVYTVGWEFEGRSTKVLVANTLYACPFLVARGMTLDRLAIHITAGGGASTKARLGIYENGTDCYPGALVVDGGEIDVSGTGVVPATIDQALTTGLYWIAIVTNGTPTIRYMLLGNTPLGVRATDFNSPEGHWLVNFTYAELPDPFTSGGSIGGAAGMVLGRIASLD